VPSCVQYEEATRSGPEAVLTGVTATEDAFAAFVRHRQVELVRLGWALTGDRQLGEDLAQTALQRLWPRWDHVSASGEPYAYAQRIMVNLWSSWRGRRWRQMERVVETPPDRHAEGDADRLDANDEVDRWLATLPSRQRAVITLRFLLDMSVDETAERLGCSAGTVKSQTAKALGHLRALAPSFAADRTGPHPGGTT
jgi:RNA polymerase sigma-70 factor (sigma-E family)